MQMNNSNVILIGFMGTGKSSVGKALAERLGWTFIDSDYVIEQQERRSIPDIFAQEGEAYFREVEHQVIRQLLTESGQVVATGGGAVLRHDNQALMLNGGLVVALTASPSEILLRVKKDGDQRPLLQGNAEDKISVLLESRKHAYDFAHTSIDTTNLSIEQIVTAILNEHANEQG